MAELTLDTEVGGVSLRLLFDVAEANRRNVKGLMDLTGYTPPEPEVNKEAEVVFILDEIEGDAGEFEINVWAQNTAAVGKFNSFQFDADFPPGVNFISATKGPIVIDFAFFALGTDGHPKEGLVGAYASISRAKDDSAVRVVGLLLATLNFTGPFAAAFGVDLKRVKMSAGAKRFPIRKTDRITPGD
ncbi:MAG: hypothetical protein IIB38_08885 [Candidatus Hydrogenedentes bacterium]|nr:hypothetical protein [Candidatus Hydrogenedentota bacterium]